MQTESYDPFKETPVPMGSPLNVVIIGGPKAPESIPSWCSVDWVPCSLAGLNKIRGKITDADILVFWPDWRLLGQYPNPDDLIQFDVNQSKLNSWDSNKINIDTQKSFVRREIIKGYHHDEQIRALTFEWVERILSDVMSKSFNVANSGKAVILVVPLDFPLWKDRGAGWDGDKVDWKGRAADSFHWFTDKLKVQLAEGHKATSFRSAIRRPSDFFDSVIEAYRRTNCTKYWPLSFSMDMSGVFRDMVIDPESCTETSAAEILTHVFRGAPPDICFYPGVVGATRDAKSLVFILKPRAGGYIVTPPPMSLDALLECLHPPSVGEKNSDGSSSIETPAPAGENIGLMAPGVVAPNPEINSIDGAHESVNAQDNGASKNNVSAEKSSISATSQSAQTRELDDDCSRAKKEVDRLLRNNTQTNPLIGESPVMLRMYSDILDAAKDPKVNVWVYGETGSGKEVLYELIKRLCPVPGNPFLITQLTGLDDTHLKSAVFGHVKGAFTGAEEDREGALASASGGILVLDNLQTGNKSFFMELLRVLEPAQSYQRFGSDRILHANCRIIAGFNRPISELLKEELPEDWPERFPIKIEIPSLDDRKDDIPLLVRTFVEEFIKKNPAIINSGNTNEGLQAKSASKLAEWKNMSWHGAAGNVRGLKNKVDEVLRKELRYIGTSLPADTALGNPDAKLSLKRGRGNPKTITTEGLKEILLKAKNENWSWSKLKGEIVVPGSNGQIYGTLKGLKNRVRDDKSEFIPDVYDYVLKLRDDTNPQAS